MKHSERHAAITEALRCAFMLILMFFLITGAHGAEGKPTKNILILRPYDSFLPVHMQNAQVYSRVFQSTEDIVNTIFSESLELSRLPTPEDKVLLRQFLQERYRGIRLDLIITNEHISLDYYKEYLADIFGDTPLLCGWLSSDRLQSEPLPAHVNGTIRDSEGAYQQTLELIPQLHPDVTEIYVLVGEGAGDRDWERAFRNALKRSSLPERVAVQFLKGLSLEEYGDRLSQLPPTAAVFYISIFVDSKKKSYAPRAALEYLNKVTAVPLYSTVSTFLEHGIVGGALVNYNDLAQELAEKGLKILRGASPHSIPLEIVQNRYVFDWRELKRFGIDEKRLPADAEVVQKSYTFWELYGLYALIATGVIVLQSLLLMILSRSRRNLRKTKTALQESLTTFQNLFDQSSDAILLIDKNRVFVECNQAALDLLRMTREEFLHRHPVMISPEFQPNGRRSDDAARDMIDQAFAKGLHRFDWTCINSEGDEFILEVALMPIEIQGETFLHTTWRDITERKQAEEEREKLQIQLNQTQKIESVGRLAGGVAHDFNNMLGVILGHTELALERAEEDSDIYSDLKEIQTAAQRSADLTKQLLTFARKQIIEPKLLNLNQAVKKMITMLQRLIGEDIDLLWKSCEALWPVKIDSSQIDQILANLCVNARHAIAGVGKVTIETGMVSFDEAYCIEHAGFIPGDFVLLSVSDDGCGMDKETLNNLFEPFFTTKEMGKGTGLGLATVYGIVKQNNGFINVYSEPGQGSTFKIYLPRHTAVDPTVPVIHTEQQAPGGNETILLVEDEPAILRLTTIILERLGYTVLAASTPSEAIRLAREHASRIDLVMTDVVMPEMNGRDLAKNLLSINPEMRRLFMSGYTANVIAHHGVLDEGVNFIQKPFTKDDLAGKLREALEG